MNGTDMSTEEAPNDGEISVEDAIGIASNLQRQGKIPEAVLLFDRVLETYPDNVDALHFGGIALFQFGRVADGIARIEAALRIAPDLVGAHNNLGNIYRLLGNRPRAVDCYGEVIKRDRTHVDALTNLSSLLIDQQDAASAIELLDTVLAQDARHAEAWHVKGNALVSLEKLEDALDCYRKAMVIRPYHGKYYRGMGSTLYAMGRETEAIEMYSHWVESEPDSAEARHYLAAVHGSATPDRCSDEFVKTVFDRFAVSFDGVLKGLEYKAPEHIERAIGKHLGPGDGKLSVLDAGCGTGLCGVFLKRYSQHLSGVDLSEGMVAKACERVLYDELTVGELMAYLNAHPEAYDLVVSADTLCYFGDLQAAMVAASCGLRAGGLLSFSVEAAPEGIEGGFMLHVHGRYSHTEAHVRDCVVRGGLQLVSLEQLVLRKERGKPVDGFVVVAQKLAVELAP